MNSKMVDVVNESDQVIGSMTEYDSTFSNDKITRAIAIFIFNDNGEILIVKRSKKKWRYPLHYCCSVGGMVDKGEEYVSAALRELREELGIQKKPEDLKFLFKILVRTDKIEMVSLFKLNYNGEFKKNKQEVDSIMWVKPSDISKMKEKGEKFTDYFLFLFKEAEQKGFLKSP